MTEYLFTYGLLKRKYSKNPAFGVPPMPIKWIGKGIYPGEIFSIAHYPGVMYKPENSKGVIGDVYAISNNPFFFKRMDAYELSQPLVKSFYEYRRVKRPVLIAGETFECWVYEYQKPLSPFKKIHSGEF